MLNDRIFMDAYPSAGVGMRRITEKDAIYIWLVEQFAFQSDGLIFWNSDPPLAITMADNSLASESGVGYIRIRDIYTSGKTRGNYISFEELWYYAVYEAISEHMSKSWNELYDKARHKEITRDEFVLSAARLEFEISEKTKDFYFMVWIPWAKNVGFKSDRQIWRIDAPQTFDKWIADYSVKAGFPEVPYSHNYDVLTGAVPNAKYDRGLAPTPSPASNGTANGQ